jgi:translation initiation factor IF-2
MTETKDKEPDSGEGAKKTLSLGGKATLSLKGGLAAPKPRPAGLGASGANVSVEVRRTRRAGSQSATGSGTSSTTSSSGGSHEEALTAQEREARAMALQKALEQGGRRTTLPKRQPIQIKQEEPKPEETQNDARSREMEELKKIEEAERAKSGDAFRPAQPGSAPSVGAPVFRRPADGEGEDAESVRDRLKKAASKQVKSSTDDRRRSRITVTQALNNDPERDRGPSLAAQRRAREKARLAARGSQEVKEKVIREVIHPRNHHRGRTCQPYG